MLRISRNQEKEAKGLPPPKHCKEESEAGPSAMDDSPGNFNLSLSENTASISSGQCSSGFNLPLSKILPLFCLANAQAILTMHFLSQKHIPPKTLSHLVYTHKDPWQLCWTFAQQRHCHCSPVQVGSMVSKISDLSTPYFYQEWQQYVQVNAGMPSVISSDNFLTFSLDGPMYRKACLTGPRCTAMWLGQVLRMDNILQLCWPSSMHPQKYFTQAIHCGLRISPG